MKAMVLAAGSGTRLHPLTHSLPKPMVPVANVPVLESIVRLLARHGFTDVAINLNYLPQSITDYFQNRSDLGVKITFSFEDTPLGTAGGVKNIRDFFDDDFLVIGGDDLTDFNLTEIMRFHRKNRAVATIGLTHAEDTSQFGVVESDDNARILQFQEKPERHEALSHWVNTGVYFFSPEIFRWIPDGFYDFGRQLFPRLLEEDLPFYSFRANGYWCDIGSLREYWRAHQDVLKGHVNIFLPGRDIRPGVRVEEGAQISPKAMIPGPVLIGKGTQIEAGAVLEGPLSLGANVYVGRNSFVSESVLWDGCRVGNGCHLKGVLMGEDCVVNDRIHLNDIVLGGRSRVEEPVPLLSPVLR